MIISGHTVYIPGQDIDTDQIIPARFLKQTSFQNLGEQLFFDQRFDDEGKKKKHPLNDKVPKIIICDSNFGCGSSREHAPQAIKRFGIEAIIAPSFGPIFKNNCQQLGIPCLQIDEDSLEDLRLLLGTEGSEFTLNMQTLTLSHKQTHYEKSLMISKTFQQQLLEGTYDPLQQLLANRSKIQEIHLKTERP